MDPELIDLLRSDLEAGRYRLARVRDLLGDVADRARVRGVLAPARLVLGQRQDSALKTLIRVFLLGEAVRGQELDRAFAMLGSDGALRLGLVRESETAEGMYRAALSLNPVQLPDPQAREPGATVYRCLISDLDDELRRGPARPDHVMGVGRATRSLIAQAPSVEVGASLDLGTGCGAVALHLAGAGAGRVVATDVSERALAFAAANARLNGLGDRIEFRRGDLFEPVRGEEFDLILSNPPFVITPRGDGSPRYEYRDGGMAGDELAERVVREGPGHLADGGTLLCLANWESHGGESGMDRVRRWIERAAPRSGALAGWAIERDSVDPAQYAETWARDGGARPGSAEFDGLVDAWLADFEARGVTAIGLGSVRLKAAGAAPGPIRAEQATGPFGPEPGAALQGAFDAAIACAGMSDAEVLATRWILDPSVKEFREHRPGQEAPREITFTTDRGIARQAMADPLLAAALGACDGDLSLAQIADALESILEVDGAAGALVEGVRELVWLGMLAPSPGRAGHR